jgi:hypothetical protein
MDRSVRTLSLRESAYFKSTVTSSVDTYTRTTSSSYRWYRIKMNGNFIEVEGVDHCCTHPTQNPNHARNTQHATQTLQQFVVNPASVAERQARQHAV